MNVNKIFFVFIMLFLLAGTLFSSDRTDALELLSKAENESKQLEIAVKNFGEKNEISEFENALNIIKLGKVKLAQTNYLDAKAKFDEYLKIQYKIYGILASKYIQRTEKLIDEMSNELVNDIGNEKVLKNFETASSHLYIAKQKIATKHYTDVIMSSRIAKKYLLSNYEVIGKKLPNNYLKDFSDCNNKIHQ